MGRSQYTTPVKVAALMQTPAFSASTNPSTEEVENRMRSQTIRHYENDLPVKIEYYSKGYSANGDYYEILNNVTKIEYSDLKNPFNRTNYYTPEDVLYDAQYFPIKMIDSWYDNDSIYAVSTMTYSISGKNWVKKFNQRQKANT